MAPPPTDNLAFDRRQQISADAADWQRVKWAGWSIAGVILFSWAGWVSLLAIANSSQTHVNSKTQELHYQQLREDIADLKVLIQRLL